MDVLVALNTFVRVVEAGSFSAVAREADLSKSAVTRLVAQLEEHFDVRLFHRTTRRLTLTEDGQDLLGHARRVIEAAEEMECALGRASSPSGLVRFGTPMAGTGWIIRRFHELRNAYPGLQVELIVGDRFGDLIEERLDVVLLSQDPPESSVARKVGAFGRIPVASPDYVARFGSPVDAEDLAQHQCIIHHLGPDSEIWRFIGADGPVEVKVSGALRANNSEIVRSAALEGLGIGYLSEFQVFDELQAGRLVRLLPDYAPVRVPIFLAYPSRKHLAPRVRVIIDFVTENLRRVIAAYEAAAASSVHGRGEANSKQAARQPVAAADKGAARKRAL
jgi:DNA-binding transcriptional LysR family regulator